MTKEYDSSTPVSDYGTGADDALFCEVSFQHAVLEYMSDAVIAVDFGGKLRIANRAAKQWMGDIAPGTPLDEWVRRFEIYESVTGARVPNAGLPMMRALRGETVQDARLAMDVHGQARRYIVASADPICGPDGAALGAVLVWRDVTERRKWVDEIRITKGRLRNAERVGHVGSWEYDVASSRIWGSQEAARMFGRPPCDQSIDAETFMSRVNEKEAVKSAIQELIETDKSYDVEFTLFPVGDTEPRVLSVVGQALRDEHGRATKIVGAVRDITEERRAQETIKEINRSLKLALDAAGANPFDWDPRTNMIRWMDQDQSLLGLPPGAFDGRYATFIDAVFAEDVAGLEAAFAVARDGHTELEHEFRVVWPDTSVHWLQLRGRYEYGRDESPIRIAGLISDVTDRRTAEENRERLAAIVECSNTAIVSVDTSGRILTWNPEAERMSGFTLKEVQGKLVADLVKPVRHASLHFDLSGIWRGEPVGPQDARIAIKNGAEIDVSFSAVPVRVRGRVVGAAAFARDVTEANRTKQRLNTQLAHLQALRSIDAAILESVDVSRTLGAIIDQALTVPGVDAATILLLDPRDRTLAYSGGGGFKRTDVSMSRFRLGEGMAGIAALARRPIIARQKSFDAETRARARLIADEGFVGYAALPLISKTEVHGVMEVFSRTPLNGRLDTLRFLESVAGQAAIALDNAALFDRLQRSNTDLVLAYDATIEGWSRALDLRDATTQGHSERVASLSLRLAHELGVPTKQLEHIRRGALLHDIGKMAIPDSILLKASALTDAEQAIMRRHADHAYEMLAPIEFLRPALDIPYFHHERWDGTGYPRGLCAYSIPLPARIFAVADVWDALSSDRPYRRAWSRDDALAHIREHSGTHFDPTVVEAFLKIVL